MSRINKVNPGQYTQAGRLTPDDRARETKKQREAASPKKTDGGRFGKARVTKEDKSEEQNTD